MKPNDNTPDNEFHRLMNEVDEVLKSSRDAGHNPTIKVSKTTLREFLEQTPGLVIMSRSDAIDLAALLMDSAIILKNMAPFLNPNVKKEKDAIDSIMERIEDLIHVHENLENAIDKTGD